MLRVIKVESKRWYYKFCEMLRVNLDLLQLLQNLMTALVPTSRVAMDTSSLLIAFGPLLTFKAPVPKLIISDEFNYVYLNKLH